MPATYIGTNKVKKVFLGTTKVKKIYLGTQKVFSGTPEFTINGTTYNPTDEQLDSGYQLILTSISSIVFSSFDTSSFKLQACLIGGGGAGSSYSVYWSWNEDAAGGGGGEGGEVKIIEVTPTEGTTYSVSQIGAGGSSYKAAGSSTIAFGYTAAGGNGATDTRYDTFGGKTGGSGAAGADGGYGAGIYINDPIYVRRSNNAAKGSNGTLFNGSYYGGGGSGGLIPAMPTNPGTSLGANTYGAGGHGESTGSISGYSGAVILLITRR